MKIDVYFTPLGLPAGDLAGRGVVVIDVLRATTTIVSALASGAKAIVPAASSEEAVRMTAKLEKDGFVLAGERKFLPIPGFSLGNSPRWRSGRARCFSSAAISSSCAPGGRNNSPSRTRIPPVAS